MRFILWLKVLFENERLLVWLLPITAGVLLVAATVAFIVQEGGVYASIAAIAFGMVGIAILFCEVGQTAALVGISLLVTLAGGLYLLLYGGLSIRKAVSARKKRRAEIARQLQYTLPQRENGYVRERLNTALHVQETEETAKNANVRLGYARVLLNKVKAAPLTVAERLQTEEMGKTFTLYRGKDCWTAEELRGLNDLCAVLLKLSAKYAV